MSQTKQVERRSLRQTYRNLIQRAKDKEEELTNPENEGLTHLIEQEEQLYSQVENPREASLDSELMRLTSSYSAAQVHKIHVGHKRLTAREFLDAICAAFQEHSPDASNTQVATLRTQSTQQETSDDEEDNEEDEPAVRVSRQPVDIDWDRLSVAASPYFNTMPTIDFMYGPLNLEHPVKEKVVAAKRRQRSHAPEERPSATMDQEFTASSESTKRVEAVADAMRAVDGQIELNRLIYNPMSFSQSIENLFDFSFLVKDGHARVTSKDGELFTEATNPPQETDYSEGKAARKQSIVSMNFDTWQTNIAKMNLQTSMLEHRDYSELDLAIRKRKAKQIQSDLDELPVISAPAAAAAAAATTEASASSQRSKRKRTSTSQEAVEEDVAEPQRGPGRRPKRREPASATHAEYTQQNGIASSTKRASLRTPSKRPSYTEDDEDDEDPPPAKRSRTNGRVEKQDSSTPTRRRKRTIVSEDED